jgi:hypothetical protein
MTENDFVTVQLCSDHVAADVLASFLQSEGVPTIVRDRSAVPGLEQGTAVLVPVALLHRAKWLIAHEPPSEAELAYLATGELPEASDNSQ